MTIYEDTHFRERDENIWRSIIPPIRCDFYPKNRIHYFYVAQLNILNYKIKIPNNMFCDNNT